jgi:hypothetical protein
VRIILVFFYKLITSHRHSFHACICLLSTFIHKERSLSVSRRLPQFTVEKNVLEFLNDLKFILYLKYDNFSTTWCMTCLPFVANYLHQSSLYNPTWNTPHVFPAIPTQQWIQNRIKSPVKNTRGFFLLCLVSNINISDDKVHNFVVNIVDLNEFISYCLLFLDT